MNEQEFIKHIAGYDENHVGKEQLAWAIKKAREILERGEYDTST